MAVAVPDAALTVDSKLKSEYAARTRVPAFLSGTFIRLIRRQLPTEIPMSTISADTGMSTAIAALERLSAESAVVLALRI